MTNQPNEAWEAQEQARAEDLVIEQGLEDWRETRHRTDNLTSEEEEMIELSRNEEDI